MKKTRKGFTLVELLIVVAILATLAGGMTLSLQGSSAKAKASTIAANVSAMKSATALYVTQHEGEDLEGKKEEDFLYDALPIWIDISKRETKDIRAIKYDAENGTEPSDWAVTVDFSGDPEKDEIKTALQAIRGYKYYDVVTKSSTKTTHTATEVMPDKKYEFKVWLYSGKITATSVNNLTQLVKNE